MPEHLPKLVELLLSKTPDVYKPAVAHAIFPPLATHLCKTTFKYIDNVEHEATLMCCLLAGTGAGKNCVQMPINMIMEDIRQRDRGDSATGEGMERGGDTQGSNRISASARKTSSYRNRRRYDQLRHSSCARLRLRNISSIHRSMR